MQTAQSTTRALQDCVLDLRRPVLIDLSSAEKVIDLRDPVPVVVPELSLRAAARRIWGFSAAAVLLVVTLPVFLLLVLAVRLTSLGPAVTTSPGIDLRGRAFLCLGFRTTTADGARTTAFGSFLDATRLAQLPRLWNVLAGDLRLGQAFAR